MRSFTKEKILSTKEASELSGYTADYLARLTRSGKINGQRFGRAWFIEKNSLEHFLDDQQQRKTIRSVQLSSEREKEYGTLTFAEPGVSRTLTTQLPMPTFGIGPASTWTHVVAAVAAFAVIISGTFVSNGTALNHLASNSRALADQISIGFQEEFSSVPTLISQRMQASGASFGRGSVLQPTDFSMPTVQVGMYRATYNPSVSFEERQHTLQASVLSVLAPNRVGEPVSEVLLPSQALTVTTQKFSWLLLQEASAAFAVSLPHRAFSGTVAIGDIVIKTTHALIHMEVAAVFAFVKAAPVVAAKTFTFAYGLGSGLAYVATETPPAAAHTFSTLTALPAEFAPRMARAIWEKEYAFATHFVAVTTAISEGYGYSVQKIGEGAYLGTHYAITGSTQGASYASAFLGLLGSISAPK